MVATDHEIDVEDVDDVRPVVVSLMATAKKETIDVEENNEESHRNRNRSKSSNNKKSSGNSGGSGGKKSGKPGSCSSSSGSSSSSSAASNNNNPLIKPRCNSDHLRLADCHLETKELWDKFNELGTEMIITKTGRSVHF